MAAAAASAAPPREGNPSIAFAAGGRRLRRAAARCLARVTTAPTPRALPVLELHGDGGAATACVRNAGGVHAAASAWCLGRGGAGGSTDEEIRCCRPQAFHQRDAFRTGAKTRLRSPPTASPDGVRQRRTCCSAAAERTVREGWGSAGGGLLAARWCRGDARRRSAACRKEFGEARPVWRPTKAAGSAHKHYVSHSVQSGFRRHAHAPANERSYALAAANVESDAVAQERVPPARGNGRCAALLTPRC